jgi:5-methyltetrahydropteroyltriglutamate--homocysteine methyltransferase
MYQTKSSWSFAMMRSTERILTTHVGSLTRPPEIIEAMRARVNQQPYDKESFAENLRKGVSEVVRRQSETGIDVVSDGEFGKSGFAVYINERLGGFERRPGNPGESGVSRGKDRRDFADFYREYDRLTQSHRPASARWVCTGPITYNPALLRIDIDNFTAALAGVNVIEAFMPVAAPITVETDRRNEYIRLRKPTSTRSRTRSRRNTKRLSTPVFSCNWTIRGSRRAGINCCRISSCRSF